MQSTQSDFMRCSTSKRNVTVLSRSFAILLMLGCSFPIFASDHAVVQIIKRNANGFAIDGNNRGEDGQDVYIYSEDETNANQQWFEIDRGNGYYSYQKVNTEFCLDGNNRGENKQNIYLWTCSDNNYNQHWLKVDLGNGYVRLQKRNASGYSIDGNRGGENKQSIYLYESSDTNRNQQWSFNYISDATDNLADRSGWTLDASDNTQALANGIDDSTETRWTTSETQHNGQWLSIDFGASETFNTIELDTAASANDYARGYLIFASNDSDNWGSPVALVEGKSSDEKITFDAVTARYLKLVQTGLHNRFWWSIYDLQVSLQPIEDNTKDWNVSTLSALRDALTSSGQRISMKPGQYDLSELPADERRILFTGSNNTVDLEGVHITVPVGSTSRESYIVIEGDNNTIIGGEFEDTYSNGLTEITDFVSYNDSSALTSGLRGDAVMNILGSNNQVNGLKLTIRGSFPYGYGSLFGIGAGSSFGLNKRCGILINGDSNLINNTQLIQESFCHGIYMQPPADNTTIRNTYIQGVVRASNDMLAEGTGSLPYRNGYLDRDGNAIEADEIHSLSEDGIRAYSNGGSVVVENVTVTKMRGGIRLYLASGGNVSNTVSLDNGNTNYNMPRNGTVTESFGNFTNAPLSDFAGSKSSQNLEITIEPSPQAVGNHNIANVFGNSHTLTFHRTSGPEDSRETRKIMVYGNNSIIVNETEYEIVLDTGTSGNTVTSAGRVTDNGDNSVTSIPLTLN